MTKEEPGKCSYIFLCDWEIFWPQGYTPQPEEKPFCIFHSPLIEQKKEAFRSAWQEFLNQHKNETGEYQDLDCSGFIFPEDVDFANSVFSGETRFEGATFMGNASFSNVFSEAPLTTFRGKALFNGATFRGSIRFDGVTFCELALFDKATFSESVWFDGVTFSKLALFVNATFSGRVSFGFTTFIGEARFGNAKFNGDVGFNQARWQGGADFHRASLNEASLDFFGGKYQDENTQEQDNRLFEGDEDIAFDHINFREAQRVRFEHVDFNRASFLRSQIENVDFIDVWWDGPEGYRIYDERQWREKGGVSVPSPQPSPNGRGLRVWPFTLAPWGRGEGEGGVGRNWIRARFEAVREEIRLLKREDKDELMEIENLYHQLILNYDRRREYEIGGEFYVRENEVRKIRKGIPANAMEYIYQWTSHYGQKWARPWAWMLLFFMVASFFMKDSWNLMAILEAMRNNLLYLFNAIKGEDLGIGRNLQLLAAIEKILIYYLFSMFLLALRRRFRR